MPTQVTIEGLYKKLKSELLSITHLKAVYVGKTGTIQSAEKRHDPFFDNTTPIAIGEPQLISKGEDYLIRNLKQDFPKITVNKNEGSGGNTDANMLYVSLDLQRSNIDELWDGDLFVEPFSLIEEK